MRLANVTGKKVEEYLKSSQTIVIGIGSIENHGRHMALGTDTLIPDRILDLLEKKCGVLIAPTIPYGSTDSIEGCTGTVNIGSDGLKLILTKIVDSLYRYGFRRFVILNGHGGNCKPIEAVGMHLHKKGAYLACLNWWLMAGELRPEWKGGHGGGEETAGLMGVDPALVDMDYINDGMEMINDVSDELPTVSWSTVQFKGASVTIPRESRYYFGNGWYGKDEPSTATPEWGREMLQAMADYMVDFIEAFERAPLPEAHDC